MDWTALILGLAGTVTGATIGYLGHRRSKTVDTASAQSGIASNHRAGTAQVIEGLNLLIEQYQEDNATFRDDLRTLANRLDIVTAERDALRLEVARLHRKYGEDGSLAPAPVTPTR